MKIGTIDINKLRGVSDKGVGLSKEFLGVIIGSEQLQLEGEAQQDRAAAELKALRQQLKAESLDTKAKAFETKERVAQQAKTA